MAKPQTLDEILATLTAVAENPLDYAAQWKQRTGRRVIGALPMNFPLELIHAAGALPVVVQESRVPITLGRKLLFEFYCGYSRSLVDQAVTGQWTMFDAVLLVDHCVALLGAADAVRFELPGVPVYLAQFPASMDEQSSRIETARQMAGLRGKVEDIVGAQISDEAIARSIAMYNSSRQLQRQIYAMRRAGRTTLTSAAVQAIVKSGMVMDVAEHHALLETLVTLLEADRATGPQKVKLHLSGHFCHAPRPELLDMIEDCGAVVVDDDLYTGYRFISTDVPELAEPEAALTQWYFDRNVAVPCSTRAQKDVDWETWLTDAVASSGADGVVILMAKFCEPHMLYYPELRQQLTRCGIPFLLIETEHEGLALEMLRTRVEALVERVRRTAFLQPAQA